jgi:Chromo (CHRromatin Organisation MOdifier) domain
VEAILDAHGRDKERRWLVKWTGWSNDHNTWEPIGHLENAIDLVQKFDEKQIALKN